MKRLLLVGASGTLGRCVADEFSSDYEVIAASRSSATHQLDLAEPSSLQALYDKVATESRLDAVICTAGEAKWAPFEELSPEDHGVGLASKLMGQINLVRLGLAYMRDGGIFVLTSGILADRPVPMTTSAATVNGGLHSFVNAASLELPRQIRIAAVSPTLVEDSAERYADFFPGFEPVSMDKVAAGYRRAVETEESGQVYCIYR